MSLLLFTLWSTLHTYLAPQWTLLPPLVPPWAVLPPLASWWPPRQSQSLPWMWCHPLVMLGRSLCLTMSCLLPAQLWIALRMDYVHTGHMNYGQWTKSLQKRRDWSSDCQGGVKSLFCVSANTVHTLMSNCYRYLWHILYNTPCHSLVVVTCMYITDTHKTFCT